jgi:predicted methyltransferase
MRRMRTSSTLVMWALAVACAPAPRPPSATPDANSPTVSPEPAPPPEPGAKPAAPSDDIARTRAEAVVAAADRTADDRALDAGRKPADLLTFFGVAPGMRVAEISAGGGYTAELLARAVGETGTVYAQNSRFVLERFAEKPWSERLRKPVMARVVRVDREFSDPLSPEAKELDVVLMVLFYHDTVWQKADRDSMNRRIFAALKPGGVYGIVDHAAKAGAGVSAVETLHRIEESVVKAEVERAGFVLDAAGDFLRDAADARDWNASPRSAGERRGHSDRFVLRFKKPAG